MPNYILAHDLGTSGNKATLFDERGMLVRACVKSYPTEYGTGNRAEQNPEHWWNAIVQTTREILQDIDPGDIRGIALSGQMMGCLCVDKKGRPLRNHLLYCDQRSTAQEKRLSSSMDPAEFYRITGHRISASYSIEKLMWIREHEPKIFKSTYKMLNAKDYINFRLCGALCTDPSDASGTNAYDLNTWQWSDSILEQAQLDRTLFPDVKQSIDVIGEVSAEAARFTGLRKGTPVVCGGGDGSCAGVGVGSVRPGMAYNYLGSSSWVALTVEKPIVDEKRRTMNWAHVVPGLLHPSGTMQTAGASFNWMVNELCRYEQEKARTEQKSVFDYIDMEIARSPIGANKLLFLPYLLGERSPRWDIHAKGSFLGLNLSHTHGDMLRAVMEGITLNLGLIVNIFRNHVPIQEMTVIGGCAQNRIWQQMMADIYQTEIKVPNYLEEATSMGAAVLAGIGVGLFPDFGVTERFIQTAHTVSPNPDHVRKYEKLLPLFDQAYYSMKDFYSEFATTEL